MAYKDILALFTSNNTYESVFIDVETGKKIFHDTVGFGQDYGQAFRQLTDDSFLQIDYDGAFIRRRDKNFKILKDQFIGTSSAAGNFTRVGVDISNGNLFWYDSANQMIKKSLGTREYGQSTSGTQISNDPATSFPNIGTIDTVLVGDLNGVKTVFVCGNGGTDILYHAPASSTDSSAVWTAVVAPVGFSADRYAIVGTRLVAMQSNVTASSKAIYVADLSGASVTFDSGTIIDATDDYTLETTDDSGGNTVCNGKVLIKTVNQTTSTIRLTQFNPVAKTFAHVDFGTTSELEYIHAGTTRYTFPVAKAFRVMADGSIAIFTRKWDSVATPTTYITGFILMNSTLTLMTRELWFTAESDPALSDDTVSGYDVLRLNKHKIEGTITKNASPVSGAAVGILNADGSVDLRTSTAGDGTYSLFCFSSEARHVVAYDSTGNSQVHLVTPTEVL